MNRTTLSVVSMKGLLLLSSLLFLSLLLTLLIGGCSHVPGDEDDVTGGACVEGVAVNPGQWPKECEYDFCPPSELAVEVTSDDPVPCHTTLGTTCNEQTDEEGFVYRVETDALYVDIRFDPALGSNPTDAEFEEHFSSLTIERGRVDTTDLPGLDFGFHRRWDGSAAFDSFSIVGGRLQAWVNIDVTEVSYDLYGFDDDCLYEFDIVLNCTCGFDGFVVPTTVQIDLPLVSPGE